LLSNKQLSPKVDLVMAARCLYSQTEIRKLYTYSMQLNRQRFYTIYNYQTWVNMV